MLFDVPETLGVVSVEDVRFVDEGAEMTIELWFGGSPGPFRIQGRVVRVGEEWKVSRDTFCHLAGLSGVPCPPVSRLPRTGVDLNLV